MSSTGARSSSPSWQSLPSFHHREDLKNLRLQFYSVAKYVELLCTNDDQKQIKDVRIARGNGDGEEDFGEGKIDRFGHFKIWRAESLLGAISFSFGFSGHLPCKSDKGQVKLLYI